MVFFMNIIKVDNNLLTFKPFEDSQKHKLLKENGFKAFCGNVLAFLCFKRPSYINYQGFWIKRQNAVEWIQGFGESAPKGKTAIFKKMEDICQREINKNEKVKSKVESDSHKKPPESGTEKAQDKKETPTPYVHPAAQVKKPKTRRWIPIDLPPFGSPPSEASKKENPKVVTPEPKISEQKTANHKDLTTSGPKKSRKKEDTPDSIKISSTSRIEESAHKKDPLEFRYISIRMGANDTFTNFFIKDFHPPSNSCLEHFNSLMTTQGLKGKPITYEELKNLSKEEKNKFNLIVSLPYNTRMDEYFSDHFKNFFKENENFILVMNLPKDDQREAEIIAEFAKRGVITDSSRIIFTHYQSKTIYVESKPVFVDTVEPEAVPKIKEALNRFAL